MFSIFQKFKNDLSLKNTDTLGNKVSGVLEMPRISKHARNLQISKQLAMTRLKRSLFGFPLVNYNHFLHVPQRHVGSL